MGTVQNPFTLFYNDKRALFLTMKMKWIPEPILMLLERLKLSSIDFQVQLLFKIFEQTILIKLQITRKRTSHSCL